VLGCLAALSRFISRLGEKVLPLYRLLKKHERFSWTAEAQEVLNKLKATLAHTPILTLPPRRRASVPLRHHDHSGGQRRHRGGAYRGGACPTSPEARVLHQ
jgi:hypothetical protein